MISFPHCKINLGLDVLRKRPDGYHDIETVMFPVRDLCDSLEIIVPEEEKEATELTESGLRTGCPPQENIVMKAWRLMHETYGIGNVRMHLHKAVPSGAGLGGGSADGAAALRMLDTLFSVGAGIRRLEALALKLGTSRSLMSEALMQSADAAAFKDGLSSANIAYSILRTVKGKAEEISATETTTVLPGDIVKVGLSLKTQ